MLWVTFVTLLYLAIGAAIFVWVDRAEMRKPVPWGELPAVLPLNTLRVILAVFIMLSGVPAVFYHLPRLILEDFRWRRTAREHILERRRG